MRDRGESALNARVKPISKSTRVGKYLPALPSLALFPMENNSFLIVGMNWVPCRSLHMYSTLGSDAWGSVSSSKNAECKREAHHPIMNKDSTVAKRKNHSIPAEGLGPWILYFLWGGRFSVGGRRGGGNPLSE